MSQYFLPAFNAVIPFILYMSFGYAVVYRFRLTDGQFLSKLNALVFRCFFPLLMFNNFYSMDLSQGFSLKPLLFMLAAVLLLVGLLVLLVPRFASENARRGVIIQGIFRSNAILFALPLSESMFGAEGVTASSKLIAVIVPLYNVLAVLILEYYGGGKATFRSLLKRIITNPLILGALAACLCLLLHIQLPAVVLKPIKAFADLTTPLSLFILGGTLHIAGFGRNLKAISAVTVLKLILIPLVIVLLLSLFSFAPAEKFAIFCFFATPIAVSSFSMASNMGGDGELAGELIAVTTIASLFTIFFWIVAMKMLAII